MVLNHNEYLRYELPDNWCVEEDDEDLFLYNPNGNGAVTMSFFNVVRTKESLDEQISILAKKFVDKNSIALHAPLMLFEKNSKITLWGTGTTIDNWFIKIWVVAKFPKIVFATYQSKQKNKEVKLCDSIVDSFQFVF